MVSPRLPFDVIAEDPSLGGLRESGRRGTEERSSNRRLQSFIEETLGPRPELDDGLQRGLLRSGRGGCENPIIRAWKEHHGGRDEEEDENDE
jgi:hypothetical protein